MLYLVDGYNITKGDPATRELSLEAQRDNLVARLRTRGADLLGRGRIVVVFDGTGGIGGSLSAGVPVEVRYAREGSADDLLVQMATAATEKVCVVSSDREVADRIRQHARHGFEAMSRESLFEATKPRALRRGKRYPASTAGLPRGANKITEELKELWLTDEGE